MYTKILVPLDGSRLSEAILPHVRTFAKAFRVPVELFQVVDADDIQIFTDLGHGRYEDNVEANLLNRSQDYLEHVADSFPKSSTAQCSAEVGQPAERIIEKAAAQAGTLVAMATRGHSGLKRWLLGSVAEKVLHGAKNPLLLMRPKEESAVGQEAPLKRMLVPLDGSELAENVFPHVIAIANAMTLEVVLLRVWKAPTSAYIPAEYPLDPERVMREALREEARAYLDRKVAELRERGIRDVSYGVLHGEAAAEIIDMAQQTPDSLVATCSHGRSGVGRWILGSVADHVVRYSGDPVLIVRVFGEREEAATGNGRPSASGHPTPAA
ncbi:MAG: universal stress protein [Candidatus Binatia bacterium]